MQVIEFQNVGAATFRASHLVVIIGVVVDGDNVGFPGHLVIALLEAHSDDGILGDSERFGVLFNSSG